MRRPACLCAELCSASCEWRQSAAAAGRSSGRSATQWGCQPPPAKALASARVEYAGEWQWRFEGQCRGLRERSPAWRFERLVKAEEVRRAFLACVRTRMGSLSLYAVRKRNLKRVASAAWTCGFRASAWSPVCVSSRYGFPCGSASRREAPGSSGCVRGRVCSPDRWGCPR